MPILVVLFAFGALVYGAYWSFVSLAARFGTPVASGVAVVVGLLVVAALARWWQRRRDVAPNLREGDWTHGLTGEWGGLRLAAGKRLCEVTLGAQHGAYIFADIEGAQAEQSEGGWRVALRVRDRVHPVWLLPMRDEREAKRWARVFGLAMAQRL